MPHREGRRSFGTEGRGMRPVSVKVRFARILSVSIVLCLLLVFFVISFSWNVAQKSREEQMLTTSLQDMALLVDSEYNEILKLSQNMVPTGSIGKIYDEYLLQKDQYDRYKCYSDFIDSLNIATFGMDEILFTSYYISGETSEDGKLLYASFSTRDRFCPEAIPTLGSTDELFFQPIHGTNNSALIKDVVSVRRPVTFSNGVQANIYLEVKTDILASLASKSEVEETSYIFLQTDQHRQVVYSNSDAVPVGTAIEVDKNGMVSMNQYIGVERESRYGFYYVLMMSMEEYTQRNNRLVLSIFVIVLIAFAILAILSVSMIWFFLRPLATLEGEMKAFGDGNFEVSEYTGNILEFARLFGVFNQMKLQIRSLMKKNEEQMKEKNQLELEKLNYQINPHFVMNSLNTIRWMSVTRHAGDITAYVTHLGYILSYSLGKTDYETTLRTELRVLENYLKLQQTTYDFAFEMDVEEGAYLDQPCARFMLQPVAENSVCHNMDEFGHLWVRVGQEGEKIHISLEDDGKGFSLPASEGSGQAEVGQQNKGIGLRYVRMTLDAFYGEAAKLRIDSVVGKGTTVHIVIPGRDAYVQSSDH